MNLPKTLTIREYVEKVRARKKRRTVKRRQLLGIRSALTKTQIKAALWDAVSLFVKMRDKWVHGDLCRICGQRPIQCAYHLVPSNDGAATRYDPENIVGACNGCNNAERWHRFKYEIIHEDLFGKDRMDTLRLKAGQTMKYSRADLLNLRDEFRYRLEHRKWD